MKTVSNRSKYLTKPAKKVVNQSTQQLVRPQKDFKIDFKDQRKSIVALKQISVRLSKGAPTQTQESGKRGLSHSLIGKRGRDHSVSQSYYPASKDLASRPRNTSTDSVRTHRPIFKKLAQVSVFDEGEDDVPIVPSPRTRNKRQQNKSITGGAKFQLKYHSYAENTTIASGKTKKWTDAYKKQRFETLGFYINCASNLIKKNENSSLRASTTTSINDRKTDLSVEKAYNRSSLPIGYDRTSHQNFSSVIDKASKL